MRQSGDFQIYVTVAFFMLVLVCLVPGALADPYVGGLPLTTERTGTVSGGIYMDADNTWWAGSPGSQDVAKTFATIPNVNNIQWARLYVAVYCGHMQNNYQGTAAVSLDGNGDGSYETVLGTESLNVPYGYIVNGGNDNSAFSGHSSGEPYKMVNDHTNRVTSDYLMWYDVTSAITSQTPKAHVVTTAGDGSFDGRIKMITLVVAYNDGDSDQIYYWVNPGHDTDTIHSTSDYIGSTEFDLSSLSGTVQSATLMVNHLASEDGSYNWIGDPIATDPAGGNFQGAYFGYNIWDMTSLVSLGDTNDLSYDRMGEYYKIPLAILTVKKQAAVVQPVTDFSATPLTGEAPLNVQFTDLSSNNPISWKWEYRLGSGSWTQFSTERSPSFMFTPAGTYSIRLTATNTAGSNTKTRTSYITVSGPATCDLTITNVRPVTNSTFAREPNGVRTTIKNIGGQASTATTLRLNASDGFSGSAAVPALTSNEEKVVTIEDTTVRNLAGGSVTYTATVDPGSSVAEADESNNIVKSYAYIVKYNGYKGKRYWDGGSDITTKKTFDLRGDLLYSTGDSVYRAGGVGGGAWNDYTVTWTSGDLILPSGATVREARLYVPYTWDSSSQVPDHFGVTFDGHALPDDTWYKDESNFGGYDNYFYGLLAYNVTSYFSTGGNSAIIHKDDANSNLAMYGLTLVVIYNDATATRKQIFMNEEFDILGADETGYATVPEEATAYVPFSGMTIVPVGVSQATLITFIPSGNGHEGDLLFNGNKIATNVWDYGLASGTQVAVDTRNVRSSLTANGNVAGIRSTAGATPLMAASHSFLVMGYAETGPMAQFIADTTTGTPPLTVKFTDQSTGSITSYAWDFTNDGTVDSTVKNPSYTYATSGTYTVKLTVTGPGGSDSEEKTDYITVSDAPVVPVAQFSADQTSGTPPLTVQFTDQSTGSVTSYAWDFTNDGTVDSIVQNPSYTYATSGTYTVKLTVTGPGGSDSEEKTDYITVSDAPVAPVAQFSADQTSGTPPLTVQFTDQSTGSITSYAWDFTNDGTVDSTVKNPSYTYATSGTYTVKLTVTGPGGSDSEVKTDYITVSDAPVVPVAQFSADQTSGTPPLTVQFTDQSTGSVTSYAWDFTNDGTVDSIVQNPSYTYATSGTYTVKLTVTGPGGSDSEVKTDYITVSDAPVVPVAQFSADQTSGTPPLTVQFTDQSTGSVTSYAWDFTNDGTVDSIVQNPSYTYATSGTYTVKLTVTGSGGSDSEVKTDYITVSDAPVAPVAQFSADQTSGTPPLTVQFTDQSTGSITSYAWDFTNDGTVDSIVQNPSYTYATSGTYTVKLTVTGPGGSDSEVKTDYITVSQAPGGSPTIRNILPDYAIEGSPGFDLTITGNNFTNGSTVWWGNIPLSTTYVSNTKLIAQVNATEVAHYHTVFVTVRNPDGTASDKATFRVLSSPSNTGFFPFNFNFYPFNFDFYPFDLNFYQFNQ